MNTELITKFRSLSLTFLFILSFIKGYCQSGEIYVEIVNLQTTNIIVMGYTGIMGDSLYYMNLDFQPTDQENVYTATIDVYNPLTYVTVCIIWMDECSCPPTCLEFEPIYDNNYLTLVSCESLSSSEINFSDVSIQNPINNELNISFEGEMDIQLYSLSGELVLSKKIFDGENVNVDWLSAGYYIMNVIKNNRQKSYKLLKL